MQIGNSGRAAVGALPGTLALRGFAVLVGAMALTEAALLRQPWLAAIGVLVTLSMVTGARLVAEPAAGIDPRRIRLHGGRLLHAGLLAVSLVGLAAGILDLDDLSELDSGLFLPIVQLGGPIAGFAGAALLAIAGLASSRSSQPKARTIASLYRACLAMLCFGALAFALAELVEHGVSGKGPLALAAVVGLIGFSFVQLRRTALPEPAVTARAPAAFVPDTLGLRVDGRAGWVDTLENCWSFGSRRAIVLATLQAADVAPGSWILDVGCGTGELAIRAASIVTGGYPRGIAIGIDATPAMIELAQQRGRSTGSLASFEVGVAERLPLGDASLDAVTSSFFFHHLPAAVKREALREMWRVLKPGGRLVIADYGRVRGIVGMLASIPMRLNFHEYVRPQLGGALERLMLEEGMGAPELTRAFVGYINVLRVVKPPR